MSFTRHRDGVWPPWRFGMVGCLISTDLAEGLSETRPAGIVGEMADYDLTALLTTHLEHFDDLMTSKGLDAIRAMPLDSTFECGFEADLTERGTGEPMVVAKADILRGGTLGETRLEARYAQTDARPSSF